MAANNGTDYLRVSDFLDELLLELPMTAVAYAVSGAYLWEFLTSLDFEWSFIMQRKAVTWPMISYFAGRYLALFTVCVAIYGNVPPTPGPGLVQFEDPDSLYVLVGGKSAYILLLLTSSVTNALATLNLAIRAMIVWSFERRVVIPLIILLIGQWAFIVAEIITGTFYNLWIVAATVSFIGVFASTLLLDLTVFILTVSRIRRLGSFGTRTRLLDRILQDGLFYFLLVIAVNATLLSTELVNLGVINLFPSAILALMVSGRLVRRVSNFSTTVPAIYLVTEDKFALQPTSTRHCDLGGGE